MSILVLLPVDTQRVQYILSCKDPQEQWIVLLRWLTEKNITFCSRNEYENPNKLKARNIYCMRSVIDERFILFQVNVTDDWEDKETPPPQFVAEIGYLAWVIVGGDSSLELEEKLRQSTIA